MSNKTWSRLGFRANPYSTDPLTVREEDVELLLGRLDEQVDFQTAIESETNGTLILSGVPGVGKTSFLNVQQYLLETGKADFGRKILSARQLCVVHPHDEPMNIALSAVEALCKSVQEYCNIWGLSIPSETKKTLQWIRQERGSSFSIGLTVYGHGGNIGREVQIPSIDSISFNGLVDIIESISSEVVTQLDFEGCFIVLDNIENLEDDELRDNLLSFRDTLFTIDNVWWVIIGQSGLSGLIRTQEEKVFQRITFDQELLPIEVKDLIKAVDKRVDKFHDGEYEGTSPIPQEIYTMLFESSNGEIRFVFKYCQEVCLRVVTDARKLVMSQGFGVADDIFDKVMGQVLVENQISESKVYEHLKNIVVDEIRSLNLKDVEVGVLKKIGELEKVKPSDWQEFESIEDFDATSSQTFSHNYLVVLQNKSLLLKRRAGSIVTYQLRGVALLALKFNLL
ncbi:MAG: hypothetical protein DCO96_03635 [Fluviicola sp. XM-24bin1]|nr:MAG: hypothetical protein DCO96_03635 [Fluviicola sp. XM-24bin1]